MKQFLKGRWVVPVAALVLTLSIGSAAFAATGSSSFDTTAAGTQTTITGAATDSTSTSDTATSSNATATTGAGIATDSDDDTKIDPSNTSADSSEPWGKQRSDETLLTGDALAQVQAAALAEAGSDATVVRVETDADGNAAYEVHMVRADGTLFTVYVDESYNVVSVEDKPAGDHSGGHRGGHSGASDSDSDGTSDTPSATSSSSTDNN